MSLDADDLLLVEAGSFSRAAQRVQLPKSTLSRRMAGLEARLGEKLLQRSTRRLALTEFGQGVLEHARVLAAEVDNALALAQHRRQRPTGRLRVSMPGDLANQALAPAMAAFVLAYPEVQLEVDLSPRRVDLIAEGFDLAIRMGELPEDSQLAARRLALFSSGLYAAPSYLARQGGAPREPEALLGLHGLMILARSGEAMPWRLICRSDGAAAAGQTPPEAAHWTGLPAQRTLMNAPETLLRLACAGVGVTAVSEHFAQPYVERGELLRLLPDWHLPPSPCWAVFPERRLMPLRTRLFIEGLATALAQCPGQ